MFALGPAQPLVLRLESDSLTAAPAALDSARMAPWVIREAALTKRFPAPALSVAGHGPWAPGDIVGVRLEHGETDWSLPPSPTNGVLRLTVPRAEQAEARTIKIKAGS